MTQLSTLAFEIGTEEIPAFDLHNATVQLETLVPKALDTLRIPYESVEVFSSPRRLIAMVSGIAEETEALVEEYKGPSEKIAFDAEGNPTKAAEGFARGKGLTVADLEKREVKGTTYVYAVKHIPAQKVKNLLPGMLEKLIENISWPKSCRWGSQTVFFSRPVRWIVALLNNEVIPVCFANIESSNKTNGHRVLAPGFHEIAHAQDLISVVRNASIIPSEAEREAVIREGVAEIEKQTGSKAQLPAKTLLEVINLCEFPTVMMGTFDEEFLEVPEEIIVDAMLMHQRYFPLYSAEGKLTNNFIIVSNGNPEYEETIVDGNERVVRARLSDAKFFYEEDLKNPLDSYVEKLDMVVFQEKLGTVRAKTERIVALADFLAKQAHVSDQDAQDVHRAAYLAKADLVTNAVIEFTSVQGVMGAYYAAASGENNQVADAIADHYRPRFSGDDAPVTIVGKLVAVADKLDTICGLFAVGQGPSGSSDPFALRRSAIGIVSMLAAGLPISLENAIDVALSSYKDIEFDFDKVKQEVLDFFITRTTVMLRDSGAASDVVEAVLAVGVVEPAEIIARVEALKKARKEMSEEMADLAVAYARANNLRDASLGIDVNEAILLPVEAKLNEVTQVADAQVESALAQNAYAEALQHLAQLRGPIDNFFDEVKVMDDDEKVKQNRLRLLNKFIEVFVHLADFGKMAK